MASRKYSTNLNAICAYFTMFPLEFPLGYLRRHAQESEWVLDPFCGRGTTNFAARLLGLPSVGIDSSPIAVALSRAKMVSPTVEEIMSAAEQILHEVGEPAEVPRGEFWELAYHESVLKDLCRLREGLLRDSESEARVALRAILLGALHGPRTKSPSYLSNQAPRTYAPKPDYSVRYWRRHGLFPRRVDVLKVIERRAQRYYGAPVPRTPGYVFLGDSREEELFSKLKAVLAGHRAGFSRVVTSPPYYGLRTYIPDQWLRNWFLGGPPKVDYSTEGQMAHSSPEAFVGQLNRVWRNVGELCAPKATLVTRFGSINDRKVDAHELIRASFKDSGWRITTIRSAGTAQRGKRQAESFFRRLSEPNEEVDVYAVWCG